MSSAAPAPAPATDLSTLASRTLSYLNRNGELPLTGWDEDATWLAQNFDGSDDHSEALWGYCRECLRGGAVSAVALDALLVSVGL